eukprot:365652-Chlamydomonas_euryale.AAC.18
MDARAAGCRVAAQQRLHHHQRHRVGVVRGRALERNRHAKVLGVREAIVHIRPRVQGRLLHAVPGAGVCVRGEGHTGATPKSGRRPSSFFAQVELDHLQGWFSCLGGRGKPR